MNRVLTNDNVYGCYSGNLGKVPSDDIHRKRLPTYNPIILTVLILQTYKYAITIHICKLDTNWLDFSFAYLLC